jgi:predicted phosphoadenosine phosphosulfate sulfurtransferase
MYDDHEFSPDEPKTLAQYIEVSVLIEAKKRIKHIIETFDKVFVCFSGGKDSLVAMYLVEEVRKEMGIEGPLDVIFRDEEVIPDDVIDFVLKHHAMKDRFNVHWYAVPMRSEKFILGKTYEYIQWDKDREWLRQPPDFAITDSGGQILNQYTMDDLCASGHNGLLAFINGIRTDESIIRFRSVINKKNEPYISSCSSPRVKLCKPIYDWSEKDVFKYFHDRKIDYCQIYDKQVWNGMALRVSTPLHAESAKRFYKLRTLYPTYYQQLVDIFPEMIVQEMYWDEFDRFGVIDTYPRSWDGIARYIRKEIEDPKMRKLALERVSMCRTIRENNLAAGKGLKNFGGYPLLWVFKAIVGGQYKRVIQPNPNPNKAEIDYESDLG